MSTPVSRKGLSRCPACLAHVRVVAGEPLDCPFCAASPQGAPPGARRSVASALAAALGVSLSLSACGANSVQEAPQPAVYGGPPIEEAPAPDVAPAPPDASAPEGTVPPEGAIPAEDTAPDEPPQNVQEAPGTQPPTDAERLLRRMEMAVYGGPPIRDEVPRPTPEPPPPKPTPKPE